MQLTTVTTDLGRRPRVGTAASLLAALSVVGIGSLAFTSTAAQALPVSVRVPSCSSPLTIAAPSVSLQPGAPGSAGQVQVAVTGCSGTLNSVTISVIDPTGAVSGDSLVPATIATGSVEPTCPSLMTGVCLLGHFPTFSVTLPLGSAYTLLGHGQTGTTLTVVAHDTAEPGIVSNSESVPIGLYTPFW
jgi:hypothetical protein